MTNFNFHEYKVQKSGVGAAWRLCVPVYSYFIKRIHIVCTNNIEIEGKMNSIHALIIQNKSYLSLLSNIQCYCGRSTPINENSGKMGMIDLS